MIECTTLYGDKKLVSAEKLIVRPAAYAVIQHDRKLLLVKTKSTKKWFFPGGALEKGERLEEALKREVKEETGIEIEVQKFFHFVESFFYYDPLDEAYHNLAFIYLCTPKTLDLPEVENPAIEETEKCQWVDIESLKKEDFQDFAAEIFEKLTF